MGTVEERKWNFSLYSFVNACLSTASSLFGKEKGRFRVGGEEVYSADLSDHDIGAPGTRRGDLQIADWYLTAVVLLF